MSERFKQYVLKLLRDAHGSVKAMLDDVDAIGKQLAADEIDADTAIEQMVERGLLRVVAAREGKNSVGGQKDNQAP